VYRNQSPWEPQNFTARAINKLQQHHWPGNVRELRNVVHRACILANRPEIDDGDLKFPSDSQAATRAGSWQEMSLEEIERQVILQAMTRFDGNRGLAAKHLGISSRTISNKLNAYRYTPKSDAA
jgi:DNA-binding NtrC family response regulator